MDIDAKNKGDLALAMQGSEPLVVRAHFASAEGLGRGWFRHYDRLSKEDVREPSESWNSVAYCLIECDPKLRDKVFAVLDDLDGKQLRVQNDRRI